MFHDKLFDRQDEELAKAEWKGMMPMQGNKA